MMEGAPPAPARPLEAEYRAARAALTEAPSRSSQGLVLVLSMALFTVSMATGSEPVRQIIVTIAVLLFHELGHYVGMRVFGFQDVRMFFIPFFGAAVSGKPRGVAAWKDGVVSLLGPLPGIFLALGLALAWKQPSPVERDAVNTLLFINVLNLLPLGGFDGSRFLQRILFARHRYLEIGFLAVAGVALLGIALSQRMWVLAIFGYLGLVLVPHRHRILREAQGLRAAVSGVPEARDLDDERGHAVFLAAREASHAANRGKPKVVAAAMEQIVDATRPPPGPLATMALFGGWLVGFAVAVVAFVTLTASAAPLAKPFIDYAVPGGGFVVSMPADARSASLPSVADGLLSVENVQAESGGVSYLVHVETMAAPISHDAHVARVEDYLKKTTALAPGPTKPITHAGLAGLAVTLKPVPGPETCQGSYLFDGARVITLLACAPTPSPALDGFRASFRRAP